MRDKNTPDYAACVGLTFIGYKYRRECWSDNVSRKFPLMLRYLPSKWITYDRNGAKLRRPKCLRSPL